MCHSWLKQLIPIFCNRVLRGTFPLQHKVALLLPSFVPLKGSSVICCTNTASLRKLLKPKGRQRETVLLPLKFYSTHVALRCKKKKKKGTDCEIQPSVWLKSPVMMNIGTKYRRRKVKAQKAPLTRGSWHSV